MSIVENNEGLCFEVVTPFFKPTQDLLEMIHIKMW